jgi:hypothetical protein
MGLTTQAEASNVLYLSIAGGNMVQRSTEDNPKAVPRDYEDKDGNKKRKFEIQHRNLTGLITSIDFEKSDFGENCVVTVMNDGEIAKLTFSLDSDYFTDFAKRIQNLEFSNEVIIRPYEMDKEGSKRKNRGVSMQQGSEKLGNFYWDGKKVLNGMPDVAKEDRKDYDTDDWKMHFLMIKKFLKKQVQSLSIGEIEVNDSEQIVPKVKKTSPASKQEVPEPDDLPF